MPHVDWKKMYKKCKHEMNSCIRSKPFLLLSLKWFLHLADPRHSIEKSIYLTHLIPEVSFRFKHPKMQLMVLLYRYWRKPHFYPKTFLVRLIYHRAATSKNTIQSLEHQQVSRLLRLVLHLQVSLHQKHQLMHWKNWKPTKKTRYLLLSQADRSNA